MLDEHTPALRVTQGTSRALMAHRTMTRESRRDCDRSGIAVHRAGRGRCVALRALNQLTVGLAPMKPTVSETVDPATAV